MSHSGSANFKVLRVESGHHLRLSKNTALMKDCRRTTETA